jgi:hypothetical protein
MQIAVHALGMSLPAQTRAYAEYRMFSAASGLDLREVHMDVLLDERKSPWTGATASTWRLTGLPRASHAAWSPTSPGGASPQPRARGIACR